jgi:FHS family L-fucose permease-like MFS transporter
MQDNKQSGNSNRGALMVLTFLFFFWGFLTVLNDILIPYLKKIFELTYFEVMFVQFAFFGAYFIGSLVYFLISIRAGDPITKIGYKNGILAGLLISATAAFLFYPAAALHIFPLFLIALFVLGLGFTLLQISANPYVAILGPEKTASSRLNLAQAFNSLGTTIGPIVGGWLIFSFFGSRGKPLLDVAGKIIKTDDGQTMSALGVQMPYLIFAAGLLLLFAVVRFTKLPEFVNTETVPKDAGALKHKNLSYGILAIFFYVGAEVAIGSLMISFFKLPQIAGMGETTAKSFLAFYWGGAMIGRFLGSISLSDKKTSLPKPLLMLFTAVITFLVIWYVVNLTGAISFGDVWPFLIFIGLNYAAFMAGGSDAARTLSIFAAIVIALLLTVVFFNGHIAMWCLIGIGLFNSIMWSNIFTLAIKGLGKYTSQGSSLLVMAILGGAIIPLIQGKLADVFGLHLSFLLPVISYIYLFWYGLKGSKITKANG